MIRKLFIAALALISATGAIAQSEIAKGDVNLMVVSDLGRNGYYDQKPVAATMGRIAEETGPDAILALGDTHHYGGVESVTDPLWITNYELIYDHPELMVNWYPVCGNHEYRGNTQAVIDYSDISRRWKMPARYYFKVFEDGGTSVGVVFIDTTPLIDKYRKKSDTYPDAANQDAEAQLQWLEKNAGRGIGRLDCGGRSSPHIRLYRQVGIRTCRYAEESGYNPAEAQCRYVYMRSYP